MFRLFKKNKEDLVSYTVTKNPYISKQEDLIKENVKTLRSYCKSCGVMNDKNMCGFGTTDGRYDYYTSKCIDCGAEWEVKVKKTK